MAAVRRLAKVAGRFSVKSQLPRLTTITTKARFFPPSNVEHMVDNMDIEWYVALLAGLEMVDILSDFCTGVTYYYLTVFAGALASEVCE